MRFCDMLQKNELEFWSEWSEIEPFLEKMTEKELEEMLKFVNAVGIAKMQAKLLQNSNFYH
jgi:hypothetical protein